MIPLAIGVAIPDEHTRLTHLETDAPLNAAFGTAVGRCICTIVHPGRHESHYAEAGCSRVFSQK